MNCVERIINGSKTTRVAAEKVLALANRIGYEMTEVEAAQLVKGYKRAKIESMVIAGNLHKKEAEWKREQDRLWLENPKYQPLTVIDNAIATIEKDLATFFDEAKQDPFYKLGWGLGAFELAAKRRVYLGIQRDLKHVAENGELTMEAWEELMEEIKKEALRLASVPSRSTSPTGNLAEECLMKVTAEVARGYDMTVGQIDYWFKLKARYLEGEAT